MGLLDGKVALVTGGSSGIGLSTVELFEREGARVAIVDLQAPPPGRGSLFMEEDVGDPTSWPSIVERVEAALGGIDIGFLNAGVTTGQSEFDQVTDQQYRRIMRVNVDGVFFGLRALLPALERRGGGNLVATASLAGIVPVPPDPVYGATKHAVIGMVRSLGDSMARRGVTVNAMCPGFTRTPLLADEEALFDTAGFPLITPEEIAAGVLRIVQSGEPGQCWFVQPGREAEPYRFRSIPGPAVSGSEGIAPPL
ncbi:MAG: SDR family NAD(P)-dependent oxidoreductase [Candidatus Dormibacteria bacterium]